MKLEEAFSMYDDDTFLRRKDYSFAIPIKHLKTLTPEYINNNFPNPVDRIGMYLMVNADDYILHLKD